VDIPTSRKAVEISQKYPTIYAAVGIHPSTPGVWNESDLIAIQELAKLPEVVAIGEIGMDGFHRNLNWEQQGQRFRAQIEIAISLDKPVLIHNRDATQQIMSVLNGFLLEQEVTKHLKCIFHAFDGQPDILAYAEDHGSMIGIGGNLTFPKSESLREMAKRIYPRTVLETDSPGMSPHPFRGKRNEPVNLSIIAQKLSDMLGTSLEDVAVNTTSNAMTYLGIK
jgi:TatD DNase family protein